MHSSQFDIAGFFSGLIEGHGVTIGMIAALAVWILFSVAYKRITGREFVKPRKERREALKRRKIVLWEYERDK